MTAFQQGERIHLRGLSSSTVLLWQRIEDIFIIKSGLLCQKPARFVPTEVLAELTQSEG